MFDELAILNRSRLMLLAGISYTLWSLHGIFWRGWSVGEMFFWMWWELMLCGLSTTMLVHRWHRVTGIAARPNDGAGGTVVSVLIVLFFATLFTGLSLAAEGISVRESTLESFVNARTLSMAVIALLFLAIHLMIAYGKRFGLMPKQQLMSPLSNRMWPVLGVYLILICDHHWRGQNEIDNSHTHQLLMGGSLLGLKLLLELRQWLKSRRLE